MKILVFSAANFSIGSGSEIRGRLICEGFNYFGIRVCVVSNGIPESFEKKGILFYPPNNGFDFALEKATREFKPDIIYGITEGYANIPTRIALKYGCGLAFDIHGLGIIEIIELGSGYGSRKKRIQNSINWLISMRKAKLITVANPTLVPFAQKMYRNVVPVIGMTDLSLFNQDGLSVKLGKNESMTQVLYAGNYFKWQGIKLLFEAMEQLVLENFEFTLVGSVGRTTQLLKEWKHLLDNEKVHIIDSVDYLTIPQYYRGADVVVLPRKFMLSTFFALPQKLLDYMASGCAIVATDLAPHRWAIKDQMSGILCKPSSKGLINGLRSAQDINLRNQISKNASKEAEERFNHLKQSKIILEAFDLHFRLS